MTIKIIIAFPIAIISIIFFIMIFWNIIEKIIKSYKEEQQIKELQKAGHLFGCACSMIIDKENCNCGKNNTGEIE